MADTTNTSTLEGASANPAAEAQTGASNRLTELRRNEKFWSWKTSLRVIICVLDIIGIGCAGYFVATRLDTDANMSYYSDYGFPGASVGALIALCLSFVWCVLAIGIPFSLKPARPIHPGVAVGVDLILWMIFIVVGLFCVVIAISAISFGSGSTIQDPSWYNHGYNGNYYLAPNNTWVYNVTYVSDGSNNGYHYNYTTEEWEYGTVDLSNVTRDCTPEFTSCAEQDAYINHLWQEKPKKEALSVMLDVILWLDVFLHFALFVWACVDTHTRNRGRKLRSENVVADRIIRDLEAKGLVTVQNGVVMQVTHDKSLPHTGQYYDPEYQERNIVDQQHPVGQQQQQAPMAQVTTPEQARAADKGKRPATGGSGGPSASS